MEMRKNNEEKGETKGGSELQSQAAADFQKSGVDLMG